MQNSVCLDCKATVAKFVPSDSDVAPVRSDVIGSADISSSNGPSHIPFWRRVFKGRGSGSLQSSTSDSAWPARPDPNEIMARRGPKDQMQHVWSVVINAKELRPSLKAKFERAVAFPLAGSVVSVRFSSDGDYLAAGYNNVVGGWKVHVYDVKTGIKK